IQVAAHDEVGRQTVMERRTDAFYKELIESLEGHSSLRHGPLVHGCEHSARLQIGHEGREEIRSEDEGALQPAGLFERLEDWNRIRGTNVNRVDMRVRLERVFGEPVGSGRIVMRFGNHGDRYGIAGPLEKFTEAAKLFGVIHGIEVAGYQQRIYRTRQ